MISEAVVCLAAVAVGFLLPPFGLAQEFTVRSLQQMQPGNFLSSSSDGSLVLSSAPQVMSLACGIACS